MRLDLFVKLKYQSSTMIFLVGIRYFMRDLLYDFNNYNMILSDAVDFTQIAASNRADDDVTNTK